MYYLSRGGKLGFWPNNNFLLLKQLKLDSYATQVSKGPNLFLLSIFNYKNLYLLKQVNLDSDASA